MNKCKWKLNYRVNCESFNHYTTTCGRNDFLVRDLSGRFCQFCGKEIEVINE